MENARSKRARLDDAGEPMTALIADHYSSRENQSRQDRERSPIIHLKKLNNWVKSVLIKLYTKPGDSVLDFGCGKGGDLQKWERSGIGFYLGVDLADGSVEDARMRYNGESEKQRRSHHMQFPARLVCADCFGAQLDVELREYAPFDVCSCQFAFHYSFESEARARQALQNVSGLLRPGGIFLGTLPDSNVIVRKLRSVQGLEFGNSVYKVRFHSDYESKLMPASQPFGITYRFHLEDAVDCPEWLVSFDFFKKLAAEYGLELEHRSNFHEFVRLQSARAQNADLMRRILGDTWRESISEDEWDAAYLYLVFAFRKVGGSNVRAPASRNLPKPAPIASSDILYIAKK